MKNPLNAYPNLLASAWGRSVAFFSFYFIDGVLIAFMCTSIAMRMKAQNVEAKADRFLRGRGLSAGVMEMAVWTAGRSVLLRASGPPQGMDPRHRNAHDRYAVGGDADRLRQPTSTLFAIVMMLVNLFAAMQRIAVNALACNILTAQERGTANGMMYAGAYLGQILGGSGVIFLSAYLPFHYMFVLVAGSILAVMLFVALPLREPKTAARAVDKESGLAAVTAEVRGYAIQAFNAFRGSRAAVVGLIFVLLPAGALSLSLSLGTNLMVEFGMSENEKSLLTLVSILVSVLASLAGGHLSDRFGRRKMLALYIVGSALPALWLAYVMYQHGWIMPIDQRAGRTARRAASVDRELLGGYAPQQRVHRTAVYHTVGLVHGHLHAGRGRHAVHRLHGHGQPHRRFFVRLAGLVRRQAGLSVDPGHSTPCSAWPACRCCC